MGRPRTPIGAFGDVTYVKMPGGRVRARTRYRDDDGQVRRVSATGSSNKDALRALKATLAQRASHVATGEITGDTSFAKLVEVWLDDLDLTNKLAPSTRALYERNMRQLVMPAFEHYLLREITVRKVDQFIKTLATSRSYSMAKQARTVLSLALGLAVRYDAIVKNPVRDTTRLHKPPTQATALTASQVEKIRAAARSWRRGPGFSGPPPDGQLGQIIEVMLGNLGCLEGNRDLQTSLFGLGKELTAALVGGGRSVAASAGCCGEGGHAQRRCERSSSQQRARDSESPASQRVPVECGAGGDRESQEVDETVGRGEA